MKITVCILMHSGFVEDSHITKSPDTAKEWVSRRASKHAGGETIPDALISAQEVASWYNEMHAEGGGKREFIVFTDVLQV
jgi:hypothetical protein